MSRRDKILLVMGIGPLAAIIIAYFLMIFTFSCGAAKFLNYGALADDKSVHCLCDPKPPSGCFP
jgi:hypothetical protein